MIAHRGPGSSGPITWVGRVPVYATTVIVLLNAAGMVAVALILASGAANPAAIFGFDSFAVLRDYEVYRCLTYAFVNAPDPWFILELVMFYIFGRDVEEFLGRRGFIRLYAGFVLLGPSLLLVATLVTGQQFHLGHSYANFATFLAFAALYPGAQLLFSVTAKVFAWILLGLGILQLLAARQGADLAVLLATAALAWYAIRHGAVLPNFDFLARLRPLSHRTKRPQLRVVQPDEDPPDPHIIIDPLLEKISRSGLASLSRRERQQLERARSLLMRGKRSSERP